MFCEKCGHRLTDDDRFCGECGTVVSHDAAAEHKNGVDDVPQEVRKWNWGAALLTWIWALGNNSPGWALIGFLLNATGIGWIVNVFVFGFNGSKWAWKNREWANVGHFQRVQRSWRNWGIVIYFILLLLGMFLITSEEAAVDDFVETPSTNVQSNQQSDPVAQADYGEGYKAGYVDGRGESGAFGDSYSEPATEERKGSYINGYLDGFLKGCREGNFDCSQVERALEEESETGTVQLIPTTVN